MTYGTIADWRTYAAERGNNAPTAAADDVATQALIRASDYIRMHYVMRFGSQCSETDAAVVEATYIAASHELTTPGFFTTAITLSQAKVLTKVDAIQWTPIKSDAGIDSMIPTSSAIDALLGHCVAKKATGMRHIGINVV